MTFKDSTGCHVQDVLTIAQKRKEWQAPSAAISTCVLLPKTSVGQGMTDRLRRNTFDSGQYHAVYVSSTQPVLLFNLPFLYLPAIRNLYTVHSIVPLFQ